MSKTYLMEKLTGQQGKYAVFNSDGSISAQTLNAGVVPQIRITADGTLTNVTVNGIQASGSGTEWYFNCSAYGSYTVVAYQGRNSYTEIVDVKVVKQYTVEAQFGPKPEGATFNDCSWANIKAISDYGTAASYWFVGDCKEITLNGNIGDGLTLTNYTTYVYILGFNHNGATNTIDFGTFKTALTGGTNVCLVDSQYDSYVSSGTYFNMNNSASNTNGWKGCRMRYYVLGSTNSENADASPDTTTIPVANTLMAALPSDLRAVMKPMTIYTDNVGGVTVAASNVTESVDYLPLLAEFEIFGTRSYANSYEQNHQKQYQYYANGNSKIKYRHSSISSAAWWWERSPRYNDIDSNGFCYVIRDGNALSSYAPFSEGVAPIFRV